jgi:hypothetical protein
MPDTQDFDRVVPGQPVCDDVSREIWDYKLAGCRLPG